nr:immunoglobulin light chain junction region [Macaca mulatta]MOW52550.1 immunoglobulin light chain junction region [Macaca mulatta]MOW52605.1 immunoglobulin light chain junction region [Macaca mulatta]MOW52674.1 immunoglobulin light chain junction region [Macaca mulatta]MOW53802.1 immunoglobulin light chain junction region [Macaca mulatta]
CQHYDGLPFTF